MKRMLMAVAAVGMTAVASARADWGGSGPPGGSQGGMPVQPAAGEFNSPNTLTGFAHAQATKPPDRYGLLPGLRRAFRVGGAGCDSCNKGTGIGSHAGLGTSNGGYGGGAAPGYPQYPPMMQGTLAFPYHQYVRSPRDYFMYEPGR